jgi:hypothetical protein
MYEVVLQQIELKEDIQWRMTGRGRHKEVFVPRYRCDEVCDDNASNAGPSI